MNARKARNTAHDAMVQERQSEDATWSCCGWVCSSAPEMYKHIAISHGDILQQRTLQFQERSAQQPKLDESALEFMTRRAHKYASDPINLDCSCDPSKGTVILFYVYLPISHPLDLAKLHKLWSEELNFYGKVKVATEGINATLAGSSESIAMYIDRLTSHPEFQSLELFQPLPSASETDQISLEERRFKFFKPTEGCRHVFDEVISIKVVEEICPLGAPELNVYNDPENKRGKLTPKEFHQKLKELEGNDDVVILDVRNYYESSIGRFPGAITPPIRKFSSFKDYVTRNKSQFAGKTILSYCTGGIRCEKATSYLRQSLGSDEDVQPSQVLMLEGGIHNYLEWIKHEGMAKDSLWLGKNYVFDARQSLGLEGPTTTSDTEQVVDKLISSCQACGRPCARYVKCDGFGCHKLVIACPSCSSAVSSSKSGLFCCVDCHEMGEGVHEYVISGQTSKPGTIRVKRGICKCEQERRKELGVEKINCT
ncbi:hypothetical protein BX616_001119 [Lobosporangium transversale]|nr:hypothetical protein BX616_001119 [Lobosporangium transversale]